jgi:DNA primase
MEITEIKQQLTLSTVLSYYSLKPDKNLRLCCPFHEDKTPSLQVYYKTHTAYCFSSNCKTHGKSLDVIDFIMHKENCSKAEAIQKAIEISGGNTTTSTTNEITTTPAIKPTVSKEQFLQNMFTYFKNAVHNSKPAQEYIKQRGLDFLNLEIGYNTGQFHHGARKEEGLINDCLQAGLLSNHDRLSRTGDMSYKPFAKLCIVFALRDSSNRVSGLYFRSTVNNDDAKHFYLKESTGLYPCYPKEGTEKLIIAESVIDTASLLQIEAITKDYSLLAAYGTNRLNDEMKAAVAALKQLKEIIFAFDNDEAGNKAALKYKEELQTLLPQIIFTKIILPNKDVNETLQAHSDTDIFIDLLNKRTMDFSFSTESKASQTPTGKNINDGEQKEDGAKLLIDKTIEQQKTAEVIKQHLTHELNTSNPCKLSYTTDTAVYYVQGGLPRTTDNLKIMLVIENPQTGFKARNKIDLYEDKQVERLCKEVAEKLSVRKDLLEADIYRLTDLLETHIESTLQQNSNEEKPLQVLSIRERQELEGFAKKPKLIKRLNELLGQTGIVGEERNRIFLLIIAISHKMPETLHALIQGSSGSGKTRLLKQVSDCMPKENVTKLTRLSDKVLYNFPENYFVNRLLCLEDIDGLSEEAEFAFRELQSNGELNSATSIKLDNGQITSGQKTVRGPIASLACTTHGEIYEDNMSRVFLIAVDESTAQTKRIIEYQNSVAAGAINKEDEEKTKLFIQKFISILQPCKVINPFAQKIHLPEEAQKIRRLNDLFQSFVKMVTILNQYQRKQDERKRLITEIEDIETAVAVMFESIVLKVDELDGSLRQFYEQLKGYLQKQYNGSHKTAEFSLREIRHALKGSKTQVFRYANDLTNLEYIKQCGGYSNRGFTYKITYWDNYEGMREKIKQNLDNQVKLIKEGTPRNATGTLQPL